MGKLFGTDGIRGIANEGLDATLAFKVGRAAAAVLADGKEGRPLFTIGKDTRISSDMLEAALTAGLCSAGADVISLGVLPTPAVAYATMEAKADAGIVISASHNPYEYNGIKIFNGCGFKLSDELEAAIEDIILEDKPVKLALGGELGRVLKPSVDYTEAYVDHLASKGENISGLKVVIDCSNGASAVTAGRLFSRFDIDLSIIHGEPNGVNINLNCGSTHMDILRETVKSGGYDIGIAFDGDADRCLVVDEMGNELDGDCIMAVCGSRMKQRGELKNDYIVATVMSNIGFRLFSEERGIELRCAAVGDRNVLEMMQELGANLGGEQSGHLIFLDESTTGDGQLAAVKILNLLSAEKKPLSQLAAEFVRYPQVLINVPVKSDADKKRIMGSDALAEAVKAAETELDGKGRVLIRASGTEALIRVMVEAFDEAQANALAERLAGDVKRF